MVEYARTRGWTRSAGRLLVAHLEEPFTQPGGDTIVDAAAALAAGGIVVVLDDEDRENEADLVLAAEYADTAAVAFFLEHTSGFLCTAITAERAAELALPAMVESNTEALHTAFLVSVDARTGTSTGISAADRAATIRALADPTTTPDELARPGHVLPLQARPGGVLERPGHTEAGIDLCRLAGLRPTALICELISPDRRTMLRGAHAVAFARDHALPVVTIAQLVAYRREHDGPPPAVPGPRAARTELRRTGEADLPTPLGLFRGVSYLAGGLEYIAFVHGDVRGGEEVPVRVHSECLTGDILGCTRCDCGAQLHEALREVVRQGSGVVVYLRGHEGRGIGLGNKLRAYALQQSEGLDTVDANTALGLPVDARDYTVGAAILDDLGIRSSRLLTNNPAKIAGLRAAGATIVGSLALHTPPTDVNLAYLRAKRDRMGHRLTLPDAI
jgi:GTP cyclohydrolase II/3,4-dihydroxy 2-butanone 4-phosphate synthase/GTP cyclohydrolase II